MDVYQKDNFFAIENKPEASSTFNRHQLQPSLLLDKDSILISLNEDSICLNKDPILILRFNSDFLI